MALVWIILIVLAPLVLTVLFLLLSEFNPDKEEEAIVYRNLFDDPPKETYTLTTFNIGFGGLDQDQDFILDGGQNHKPITNEEIFDNLIGITEQLHEVESDFYFLQEVDRRARRSTDINQIEHFMTEFSHHNIVYALNFNAALIPYPLLHPIGHITSGLLTLSRYKFSTSKRIASSNTFRFPKRLFYPKRCFTVHKTIIDKKPLYLIHIHLPAYDENGSKRRDHMEQILSYTEVLLNDPNNHVIIGGDFNVILDKELKQDEYPSWGIQLFDLFDASPFTLQIDPNQTTVRSLNRPYEKGISKEYIIDGFLTSPNINVKHVVTHQQQFKFSDHNPVTITFELN